VVSVTQRITIIEQPRGGYLPISKFDCIQIDDRRLLITEENIPPTIVGTVVDYISRWQCSGDKKEAFRISLKGAVLAGQTDNAVNLFTNITDLSDYSINNACKLVYFDAFARGGHHYNNSLETINPDHNTCENIRIMVKRSLEFFNRFGPVTENGFHMLGGYSKTINTGDGDFLTKDAVWEFKVLKNEPNSKHTLQILVYYIMGKNSINPNFSTVRKLGIFNPRQNKVYICDSKNIDRTVYAAVSKNVICYGCD